MSLKEKIKERWNRTGGNAAMPVVPENDLKGRIDRIEAILEQQFGHELNESPPEKKKAEKKKAEKKKAGKKKAGKVSIGLLVVMIVGFALYTFAADIVDYQDTDSSSTTIFNLDGDGDGTATLALTGAMTVSETITASGKVDGTPADTGTVGTGVTAVHTYGQVNKSVLTLDDVAITVVEGGSGTNGYGGVKIYDFPAGRILIMGLLVENFTCTVDTNDLDDADGGDFSFGTTITTDATLDGTDVDLCPSTSIDPIVTATDNALAASAQFDGTATAKDININMLVDDGDISQTVTNTVDAVITIHWVNLGDY